MQQRGLEALPKVGLHLQLEGVQGDILPLKLPRERHVGKGFPGLPDGVVLFLGGGEDAAGAVV